MSKNLNTIVGLITIALIAFVIVKQDKDVLEKPMTLSENVIWIDFKDDYMDIWMKNVEDVYGLQFEFDGVKLIDTDGGILNREGFNVSHNEKVILSFSYEGNSIGPGEHMLISTTASYKSDQNSVKMINMVLAGYNGKSLDFVYYNSNFNTTTFRTNQ